MTKPEQLEQIAEARQLATENDRDYYVVTWRDGECDGIVTHEQLIGLLPISPVVILYSTVQDA